MSKKTHVESCEHTFISPNKQENNFFLKLNPGVPSSLFAVAFSIIISKIKNIAIIAGNKIRKSPIAQTSGCAEFSISEALAVYRCGTKF